jgi:purine-binding chemotaxis protein CheW
MPTSKPQRQIDWEAVWKTLNWDDDARQQTAERERLRQRAEHYAAPAREETVLPENARTVLTFDLGAERYGIDVMVVRGIRTLGSVSRVPGVPAFYRGIINVRGQIISVIDLRTFFQMPFDPHSVVANEEIVIARANKLEIALLAHQVNGVETISPSAITSVDHMPYAIGITPERLILLDVPQLFADERLIIGGVNE